MSVVQIALEVDPQDKQSQLALSDAIEELKEIGNAKAYWVDYIICSKWILPIVGERRSQMYFKKFW